MKRRSHAICAFLVGLSLIAAFSPHYAQPAKARGQNSSTSRPPATATPQAPLSSPGPKEPLARAPDPTPAPAQSQTNSGASSSQNQEDLDVVPARTPSPPAKTDDPPGAARRSAALPANDDIASALPIDSFPFADSLDTSSATIALDDPNMHCGRGGNANTVWYQLTSSTLGRLHVSTVGSDYDTVLAAFSGTPGALTWIMCNDDAASVLQSEMVLTLRPGVTYYLEIANYGQPGGGQLQLSLDFTPAIAEPLDIVLVQDETGSMKDDINSLRQLVPQIWDGIDGLSSSGFRMSVVGFRDYARDPWGDTGDWVYRRLGDFTDVRDNFVAAAAGLSAAGGNDGPEGQYMALDYLLSSEAPCVDSNGNGSCSDPSDTPANQQPQFRSGARRIILLATDASFHTPANTPGYPGSDRDAVVRLLRTDRAIVIGLVPGGAGKVAEVDDLAAATGGSTQNTGGNGEDVAAAIAAALDDLRPVSAALSTVQASVASSSADGSSQVAITVTLRDTGGAPVVGKTVLLYSDRGPLDQIVQPSAPTDESGQTIGLISSTTSGLATVRAQDVSDGVDLSQTAPVQFEGAIQPPDAELQRAIDMYHKTSHGALETMARVAKDIAAKDEELRNEQIGVITGAVVDTLMFVADGVNADQYIQGAIARRFPGYLDPGWSAMMRPFGQQFTDSGAIFNQAVGEMVATGNKRAMTLTILQGGMMYYAAWMRDFGVDVAKDKAGDLTSDMAAGIWKTMLTKPGKLSQGADKLDTTSHELTAKLDQQHADVSAGIPALTAAQQSAYSTDIWRRSNVPNAMASSIEHQSQIMGNVLQASQGVAQKTLTYLATKFLANKIAEAKFGGAGKLAMSGSIYAFERYLDARKLSLLDRARQSAPALMAGASDNATEIFGNESVALYRLANAKPPQTPDVQILGFPQHYSQGKYCFFKWCEQRSYSVVTLYNNSDHQVSVQVVDEYSYNAKLFGLPWAAIPLVTSEVVVLPPYATQQVTLRYKHDESGGSPEDKSWVTIYALATNDTGTFMGGLKMSPWDPQHLNPDGTPANRLATLADSAVGTSPDSVEEPVDVYVMTDAARQTYQEQLWISNPFDDTVDVTISQPLPSGVTVLEAGGSVASGMLTWTGRVYAHDIISTTLLFRYPADPGTALSLPPAQVQFTAAAAVQLRSRAAAGTSAASAASYATTTASPSFQAVWPIELSGHAPVATAGVVASMPITLTNLSDLPQSGAVETIVFDQAGSPIMNQSQPFGLAPDAIQSIDQPLPMALPIGNYALEVWLQIGASKARMIQDLLAVRDNPPTIANLEPAAVAAGGPAFKLTVTGANFVDGAVVQWNGEARPTTFIDSSHLTTTISAADIAASGTASIIVVNPGMGGRSNAQPFTITTANVSSWWDFAYAYRRAITIDNGGSATLPAGYPILIAFDNSTTPTAWQIYDASRAGVKGADLRIVWRDQIALPIYIQAFSRERIQLYVPLQATLAPGASIGDHALYYGNPDPGPSVSDVNAVFPPTADANTIGLWHVQEGQGFTVYDTSGNDNAVTVRSSGGNWGWEQACLLGSCIHFGSQPQDGAGTWLEGPGGGLTPSQITVEAWIREDVQGVERTIVARRSGGGMGWQLFLQDGQPAFEVNYDRLVSNSTLTSGQWYHLAGTYDGSTLRIYLNGALVATKPSLAGMPTIDGVLRFGKHGDTSNYFNGAIQHVRISNIARDVFPVADLIGTMRPSIVVGSEDIPSPLDNAFVKNALWQDQSAFVPGDSIRLALFGTVHGTVPMSATLWWIVTDPDGIRVPELSFDNFQVTLAPGAWNYYLPTSIPTRLSPGTYTFLGEFYSDSRVWRQRTTFVIDAPPLGWIPDQWRAGSSFVIDTATAHSGGRSARIISVDENDARWTQHVAVKPNTSYLLSGWIKTEGVRSDVVGASLGLVDDPARTADVRGTQDWTYVEVTINSGDRTDLWVGARLGHWSNATTGTVWFDDLALHEQTATGLGANLLINPGFEQTSD